LPQSGFFRLSHAGLNFTFHAINFATPKQLILEQIDDDRGDFFRPLVIETSRFFELGDEIAHVLTAKFGRFVQKIHT